MENPATWGAAERIVHDVVEQHFALQNSGEAYCGLSLERQVTDALREAGQIGAGTPPGYYDDLAKQFAPGQPAGVSDEAALAALDAWLGYRWDGLGGDDAVLRMKAAIVASRNPPAERLPGLKVPEEEKVSDSASLAALDVWYLGTTGSRWNGKGGRGALDLMKDVIRTSRNPPQPEQGRMP